MCLRYTVNGYTVAAAGFQEITTLSNCMSSATACGPVGTDSPIAHQPHARRTSNRVWGLHGIPSEREDSDTCCVWHVRRAASCRMNSLSTLRRLPRFRSLAQTPMPRWDGRARCEHQLQPPKIRNRYIQQNPKRAAVYNWNANHSAGPWERFHCDGWICGSRSLHLSAAADDINLVQASSVSGRRDLFSHAIRLAAGGDCSATRRGRA